MSARRQFLDDNDESSDEGGAGPQLPDHKDEDVAGIQMAPYEQQQHAHGSYGQGGPGGAPGGPGYTPGFSGQAPTMNFPIDQVRQFPA